MPDLLAARSQMAMSLGFHILFAMVGGAMPVLMVVAERRWQRTGDHIYLDLAHRWAKGTRLTMAWLWVLVAGGLVLFPSLIYLLQVFKREPTRS